MKIVQYFSLICLLSLGYSNTYSGFNDITEGVSQVFNSTSAGKSVEAAKKQKATILAEKAAAETIAKTNRKMLIDAAKSGDQRKLKKFLDSKYIDKNTLNTALIQANLNNQTEIKKILIDTGKLDSSQINKASLIGAAKFGDQKKLKKLLNAEGIDKDWLNKAFTQAALNGQAETAKILLDTGKIDKTAKKDVIRGLTGNWSDLPASKKGKENLDEIKALIEKSNKK